MVDCCLTRLCDTYGERIQGGSFHCSKCDICICFSCGIELLRKENYPANCPKCGAKLEDSLFRLLNANPKILDET